MAEPASEPYAGDSASGHAPTAPGAAPATTPAAVHEGTVPTLIGVAFPDEFLAQEFLTSMARLASKEKLKLSDAVFVTKSESGDVKVHETRDLQPGQSAVSGAFLGSLIGLLVGGPIGWAAGGVIGAGAGAATAKLVDLGIDDEWVDWFRTVTRPGTTVLAILAEQVDAAAVADELRRFPESEVVYSNLADGWRNHLASDTARPEPLEGA